MSVLKFAREFGFGSDATRSDERREVELCKPLDDNGDQHCARARERL